jgi:hypothetical protein
MGAAVLGRPGSYSEGQRGVTKDLGAKNGQIVAILSIEARRDILTANATTPYYLGFADLSTGPLVMVIPPRGVQGGISDAWQQTIPGTGSPGTYLVLAPGQKLPNNVTGYTARQSPTFNIFLGARLTDADPDRAKEALAQLQMYPYAQHDNPPKMDILDAGTALRSAFLAATFLAPVIGTQLRAKLAEAWERQRFSSGSASAVREVERVGKRASHLRLVSNAA